MKEIDNSRSEYKGFLIYVSATLMTICTILLYISFTNLNIIYIIILSGILFYPIKFLLVRKSIISVLNDFCEKYNIKVAYLYTITLILFVAVSWLMLKDVTF